MARCKGPAHRCQSGQRNRNPNRQPSDGNVPGSDQVSTARLIDSGKIDNAKAELARALNTLVVTSVAFPLPVLRAEAAMAKAEKLAETDRRDAKQNEELSTLLSSVRTEIEMAQIPGYGKKADFKPIFDQVKSIEQKSAGGKSGKGWFDELKTRIQKLF